MRVVRSVVICMALALAGAVSAQDRAETLADIRQELSVLYVEIQKLKRELSTTGATGEVTVGGSLIDRVAAIEGELQRLTALTEELGHRIERVATDGGNRIGDLEFRLCELEEGCDISTLGEGTTLGGVAAQSGGTDAVIAEPGATDAVTGDAPQMAVGEQADFEAAETALANGEYVSAAEQFANFQTNYPGGPLNAKAGLLRGEALEGAGQTAEAARAYLDTFSASPNGPEAPDALYRLGNALGQLGQTQEACVTLGEVGVRFPSAPAAQQAATAMQSLGCQ